MKTLASVWRSRFMAIARTVSAFSKDPDCQVGAVLVSPDRRETVIGYNGYPRDIDTEGLPKGKKLALTVHAEMNAILNSKCDIKGWTLYVTKFPCEDCAKHLLQCQIATVVAPPIDHTSSWAESQDSAFNLLKEQKVHIHYA